MSDIVKLQLGVDINVNPNEISTELNSKIEKAEKNTKKLEVKGILDDKEIQKQLKNIGDLANKKLKGVNISKALGLQADLFSDTNRSLSQYRDGLKQVVEIMTAMSKMSKTDLNIYSKGTDKEQERLLEKQMKYMEQEEKLERIKKTRRKEASDSIDKKKISAIEDEYKTTRKYQKALKEASDIAERLGMADKFSSDKSVKREIEEVSKLKVIYEDLVSQREKYSQTNSLTSRQKLLQNTQDLVAVTSELKKKQEDIKDLSKILPDNFGQFDVYSVEQVLNKFVDFDTSKARKELEQFVKEYNDELSKINERVYKRDSAEYKENVKNLGKRGVDTGTGTGTANGSGGSGDISQSEFDSLKKTVSDLSNRVDDLDSKVLDISTSIGDSSNNVELYKKAFAELGNEFKDVEKYAVPLEDTLKRINKLVESNQFGETKNQQDLIGYANRALALNPDVELSEDAESWLSIYSKDHEVLGDRVNDMTLAQLDKVEELTPSFEKVFDEIQKINTELNDFKSSVNSLGDTSGISVLSSEIESITAKLNEAVEMARSFSTAIDYNNAPLLTEEDSSKILQVYRGVENSFAGIVSDAQEMTTFFTTNLDVAKEAYGKDGKVFKANVVMKNPVTADMKGGGWEHITYLGQGLDETSSKLLELERNISTYQKKLKTLKEDGKKFKETQDLLNQTIEEQNKLLADKNNPYVKDVDTDTFAKKVRGTGKYDGVILKNIVDGAGIEATDIITFSPHQIKNAEVMSDVLEDIVTAKEQINKTTISTPEVKAETQAIEEQTDALNANVVAQERVNDAEKGKLDTPASTTAEEMQKELGIVKEVVAQERQELDKLRSTIDTDIVQAIRKKDDEFLAEKKVVERVVASEISNLNELIQKIEKVIQSVKELSNIPVKLDINAQDLNDFDPNKLESINKLKASVGNIHTDDLQNLSNALKEVGKANISKNIDKLATSLQNLKEGLNKIDNGGTSFLGDIKEILAQSKDLENLANVLKESKKKIKEVNKGVSGKTEQKIIDTQNITEAKTAISSLGSTLKNALGGSENSFDEIDNQLKKVFSTLENAPSSPELTKSFDSIIKMFNDFGGKVDLRNNTDVFRQQFTDAKNELKACASIIDAMANDEVISEDDIIRIKQAVFEMAKLYSDKGKSYSKNPNKNTYAKLLANMEQYRLKITGASKETRAELGMMIAKLREVGMSGSQFDLTGMATEFHEFTAKVRAAGEEVDSFFTIFKKDIIKKSIGTFAQFFSLYDMIQYGRQAFTIVKEINSAQIELRKVTTASEQELVRYWDTATEAAEKYGIKINEVINSTADWSRTGYSLQDAEKLADATALLQTVGDNMTQESSSEGLVSTLKGFGLATDEAERIVDVANQIANTQPIDTAGIFEGLQRSASSLSAAGNSLEQGIALITTANSVVQNPESVATMLKTMTMRIRSAKSELEDAGLETDGMVESTAKLREEIMALSGVDILLDENTFKDTYTILDELAQKWSSLTDIQQASITELISGKRGGNVMSALMQNFDIARESLDTALNDSEGSAMKELENYQKGLQYSVDVFSVSLQELSQAVMDDGFLKGMIDSGTSLINILTELIDKFGVLSTLGAGLGAALSIKNVGILKMQRIKIECFAIPTT